MTVLTKLQLLASFPDNHIGTIDAVNLRDLVDSMFDQFGTLTGSVMGARINITSAVPAIPASPPIIVYPVQVAGLPHATWGLPAEWVDVSDSIILISRSPNVFRRIVGTQDGGLF